VKKENIVVKTLKNKVTVFDKVVEEIFFDLKHIQYGWDKDKRDYKDGPPRNHYTSDDIVDFFEQLNTLCQKPKEQICHKKTVKRRFIFYIFDGDKKLKMVVDFMLNESTVVVTIY
jgi:hypothetical protein